MGAGTSLDVAGVARAFISGIFGIETFGIEKDGIFGVDFPAALLQAHAKERYMDNNSNQARGENSEHKSSIVRLLS